MRLQPAASETQTEHFPVLGTDRDPIPGWIDNLYGFSAFWVLAGKGLLRVTKSEPLPSNNNNNLIPGDVVAKTIILAAWAKGIGIPIRYAKFLHCNALQCRTVR